MKSFFQQKRKNNRAFTIVEALLAVSIFSLSVVVLMSVLSEGIADTGYAKKKIMAVYLAQEGVETMRNMRDSYILYSASGTGWSGFSSKLSGASCGAANGCYFNDSTLNFSDPSQPIIDITMTACSTNCPTLLYNSTSGKYGYTTGTASGLRRKIQTTTISANEMKISSTVFWTQESGTYNITLSENLFNWTE